MRRSTSLELPEATGMYPSPPSSASDSYSVRARPASCAPAGDTNILTSVVALVIVACVDPRCVCLHMNARIVRYFHLGIPKSSGRHNGGAR